jgi:DNA-binding PadR family transcriptional regulator
MTEYILLGFLMEQNMTGYEMKQHMSISTSYFVDASFGSIYPSLKRLEQKGLVEFREITESGKAKKVYSIKDRGREELKKWLVTPLISSKVDISSVLAKIFFFRFLPQEQAVTLIKQGIQDLEASRQDLLNLKAKVAQYADPFELCTLDFGLDNYDFTIRWCQGHLLNIAKQPDSYLSGRKEEL